MAISQGTWAPIAEMGLNQAISETSTTKYYEIGKIVRCRDVGSTAYGEGEFIYLKGLASTAVGDLVVYDAAGVTTRTVAKSIGPAAVAMSANVASQYGWYQIQGLATVKAGTVSAAGPVYLTATAGQVSSSAVTGDVVSGARAMAADDTGLCKVGLNRPACGDYDNT